MAKKAKTVFVCNECGSESAKWVGQCPVCGAWNSMFEQKVVDFDASDKRRRTAGAPAGAGSAGTRALAGERNIRAGRPERLAQVRSSETARIDTGIKELNRVLGGGLVPGSLCLISGEPGIGKSTIILQAAQHIAASRGVVLYVSGEESEEQIRMRADRVCGPAGISDNLFILAETNIENVSAVCESLNPVFLIVDSIQTMYSADLESAPGSVSQVRACGNELMRIGKTNSIPVFIVAHVTKSGDLAGPRIVEHMVDCVLSFTGDRSHELRILRSQKNRFGTTSEIGAFEMAEEGLIEIENLSGILMEEMDKDSEGAVATAVYEGTRPLILEVQALTSPCNIGFARRTALGIDSSRLNMLLAVLEKRGGLSVSGCDAYINVIGGLTLEEPAADLATALAVASSYLDRTLGTDLAAIGEIGLSGEIRSVSLLNQRLTEISRLGFRRCVVPAHGKDEIRKLKSLELIPVRNIGEAVAAVLDREP